MDLATIFLIDSSLLVFLCIMVLVIRIGNREYVRDNSAYWLASAHCSVGLGMFLIAMRNHLPLSATILLANFLILFSLALLNRALISLTEHKRDSFYWLTALAIAGTILLVPFTFWHDNIHARGQIDSVVIAIGTSVTASQLLSSRWKAIRPATRGLGIILLFLAFNSFVRAFFLSNYKLPVAWLLWSSACGIVGISLCYLWMDSLKTRAELQLQALTDPLTGLFNRRAVEVELQRELFRGARGDQPISALMIDMDRFKQLNDTYGHAVGDQALCAVARAMETSVRGADIISRISGDEFIVILPETGALVTEQIAMRIAAAIAAIRIDTGHGRTANVSCSIGSTTLNAREATLPDLFRHSDAALYIAKSESNLTGPRGKVTSFR